MKWSDRLDNAIDSVYNELSSLSEEDFNKRLDEYKDTNKAKEIMYWLDHNSIEEESND